MTDSPPLTRGGILRLNSLIVNPNDECSEPFIFQVKNPPKPTPTSALYGTFLSDGEYFTSFAVAAGSPIFGIVYLYIL
jgi:hypothetical protein